MAFYVKNNIIVKVTHIIKNQRWDSIIIEPGLEEKPV